jgi:hypothetical protein
MKNTEAMNDMSLNGDQTQQQEQAQEQNAEGPTSQRITIQYEKFLEIKLMLAHRLKLTQEGPEEESKLTSFLGKKRG